jgi:hypothetical protein
LNYDGIDAYPGAALLLIDRIVLGETALAGSLN